MFSLIRLILKLAFVLFLLALVVGYYTNPTTEEFQKEIETYLDRASENQDQGAIEKAERNKGNALIAQITKNFVVRKNYYICSVFELKLTSRTYYYLGAYHFFVPLQRENPMDILKAPIVDTSGALLPTITETQLLSRGMTASIISPYPFVYHRRYSHLESLYLL